MRRRRRPSSYTLAKVWLPEYAKFVEVPVNNITAAILRGCAISGSDYYASARDDQRVLLAEAHAWGELET